VEGNERENHRVTETTEILMRKREMEQNKITEMIIGAAIEVHRHLGPGLFESTYQECLAKEMTLLGLDLRGKKNSSLNTKD